MLDVWHTVGSDFDSFRFTAKQKYEDGVALCNMASIGNAGLSSTKELTVLHTLEAVVVLKF